MELLNTMEEYRKGLRTLSPEEMQQLHRQLVEEVGNDPDALEIYDDLVGVATRYAEIRGKWLRLSNAEKAEQDKGRTACHNSVIVHFNMLARCLRMQGKKALWRDALGYEEDDRICRKTVGDFACYIVFVNGLCAR